MALMENKKQLLLIVVAVAVGLLATIMTSNYVKQSIEQQTNTLAEQYDAKQKEMVAQLSQQSEAQIGALKQELQQVRVEQQQALQQQMAAMQAAQQARQAEIQKPKAKPPLAMRTPEGKRAITVMIDSLAAIGGLLNPGDNVDVIAHLNIPENASEEKKTVTAMIFQNLQVLAVNTNLEEPGQYDAQQSAVSLKVTFAVDPQEAGLLSFANKNGKLELALRGTDQHDKQIVKTSTWKTLADYVLQNQGADIKAPEDEADKSDVNDVPDTKPSIQIFRGGKEL